jgi:hypothetical protein
MSRKILVRKVQNRVACVIRPLGFMHIHSSSAASDAMDSKKSK